MWYENGARLLIRYQTQTVTRFTSYLAGWDYSLSYLAGQRFVVMLWTMMLLVLKAVFKPLWMQFTKKILYRWAMLRIQTILSFLAFGGAPMNPMLAMRTVPVLHLINSMLTITQFPNLEHSLLCLSYIVLIFIPHNILRSCPKLEFCSVF